MSWIERLYETYERCDGAPQFSNNPLMPISHAIQQAHIEVNLDENGVFLDARYVSKEETIIQATEKSAGRTAGASAHPLCDKIQYCAADYSKFGGTKDSFYLEYLALLREWCAWPDCNPKVRAVLRYVERGSLVADLVECRILFCDSQRHLLTEWKNNDVAVPEIFRMLTPKDRKRDQGDAFVRWSVQVPGDPITLVSEDPEVRKSWISFDAAKVSIPGLCMVTGEAVRLASSHPKRLRHSADGAKLISSNDISGYTFRGRFANGDEACGIGFEVTQKAHNALRWLIERQGDYGKAAEQVFLSWSIGGKKIPDPLRNTAQLFLDVVEEVAPQSQYQGDAGQLFALRLRKLIAGYGAKLGQTEGVVVMGLDSATPGRMAIIFYRELTGSEFLERLQAWHVHHAWPQNFSKDVHFVGVAAPKEIAEAAYGRRLDDALRKATIERLLPCIVDGDSVPRDLVESSVRRVCNRSGMKPWEWEKCLGIACGLYRGKQREENYQMSLEEDRVSRDYLFGRLLAIADHLEQRALHVAGEQRDTNAGRLMQRFAEHPCSTWRNIELALPPYRARLRSRRPALLVRLETLLDEVAGKFLAEEYTNDSKLSGEFLLGYHCQRAALWQKSDSNDKSEIDNQEAVAE